jgi:hypothetical protein
LRPLPQSRELIDLLNAAQRLAREEQAGVLDLQHLVRALSQRDT